MTTRSATTPFASRGYGGIGIREIHWINRPTFQQALEILGHRGRGTELRCSIPRVGSNAGERLQGSAFPDDLVAKGGADRVFAEGGDDCLNGGAGGDLLKAGGGTDNVKGGSGDDSLATADRFRDAVSCGSGVDRVSADARDRINSDCEQVDRPATKAKEKGPKKK